MLRCSAFGKAPVFCRIVDNSRMKESLGPTSSGFPMRIELGDGVTECSNRELQCIIDDMMKPRSAKFSGCAFGQVLDRRGNAVEIVKAYEKYIVTGSMRSGYVKPDHRFGPRLTGYDGATTKPGLRWNGEE